MMTDDELRNLLTDRLTETILRIGEACARVGRDPKEVTLVAVTKTVSVRVAGLLPELGVFDLGENRPQSLWSKAEALAGRSIRWHMIGHLQRNKVERTLPIVELIHAVDSVRLLEAIGAEGAKLGIRPHVMLQVNVSREAQKNGFDLVGLHDLIARWNVEVVGLMGMAAFSDNPEQARPAFVELRQARDELRVKWPALEQLSMGMSGDYEVAVEEGATFVRLGSTLFAGLDGE